MKCLSTICAALATSLLVKSASAAVIELNMGELPAAPVNGISIEGVTFGFTIGGAPSTDARYDSPNGGIQSDTQDPVIEGNTGGVLTLDFAAPTTVLQFGVSLSNPNVLSPGFTVQLFDPSLTLISNTSVNTARIGSDPFSEGVFSYPGSVPVRRAMISFNTGAGRFGFDNLMFDSTEGAACCNTATCRILVPPDNPFNGPLYYSLQSSCSTKSCAGSITLATGTTTQAKCNQLVAAINSVCASAGFQVDATGNLCTTASTFIVTDTGCNCANPATAGKGVTLMLSNSLATGQFLKSGFLPDYENDEITSCGNGAGNPTGGSLVNLSGTSTGTPIVGSQASVVFDVFTNPQVTATVLTSPGESPAALIAQGVNFANQALAAQKSNVRCAVDPNNPTSLRCSVVQNGGGGISSAAASTSALDVPITVQLNDVGLVRLMGGGPPADIATIQTALNTAGGVQSLMSFAPVTTQSNPPSVPATGNRGIAGLSVLLLLSGLASVRLARSRRRSQA